ncbi:ABC transporter ATP-binding protein [Sphingopyxis sp.]|jgi:lipoprotein-releasing system ATP-binding protein|uniref:ABC transporter ATP-binding protein n=1 Tax=Sphingopyxis sp. TaxID=1908224 RepID=UPI002DE2622F|nr:ABC transporter ATP-binding protein [Sphingopyxis sp.]
MSDIILELKALKRSFTQGEVTIDVLRGVDAHLKRGEIVALLGPSGSGKSTMLQAVGLLEGGFDGTIRIDGEDVTRFEQGERTKTRREKIGFVYQFHHLLPDFNAIENVVLPQLIRGATQAEAEERAADLLGRLGLGERLHHKPSKLSGGEQQRVAVARALANRPLLVLADEPTGNLDEATADRVFDQFVKLVRDHGSAALVATHNERLAARMDRVLRLHEGRIEDEVSMVDIRGEQDGTL